METMYKNLFAALKAEKDQDTLRFIDGLNEEQTPEAVLSRWQYKTLLPKGKQAKEWELQPLKDYLIQRYKKHQEKRLQKEIERLQTVEAAPDLRQVRISMEWKRSRMWGNNPTAEAEIWEGEGYNRYNSGSIGGCGYDKGSTAVANVLNQSNAVLKLLYTLKDQHPTTDNRELFGYGSGYGILPYIEGGVGLSGKFAVNLLKMSKIKLDPTKTYYYLGKFDS